MRIWTVMLFLLVTSNVNASEVDYFKALDQIKRLPKNAIPIVELNLAQKQKVLALLKDNDFSGDQVQVYQGDFTNEKRLEYAVVTTGGTMHVNNLSIFKVEGKQYTDIQLDNIVTSDLIPGGDMSNFYYHVGNPFAYLLNGKTYIRFMDYPGGSREYNKTLLAVCAYMISGNHIKLTGPNWTYKKIDGPMVTKTNCIGA